MSVSTALDTDLPVEPHPLGGIALRLITAVLLATMFALVKLVSTRGVNVVESLFYRQCGSALCATGLVALGDGFASLHTKRVWAHVGRMALGVVAMLTDTVLLLPFIGAVFYAEALSNVVQGLSKRLRGGKKVFKIAPMHHHFEASGWLEDKVTMRFWVLGQVAGVVGLIIFLLGDYI